jgi:hypothetical protein
VAHRYQDQRRVKQRREGLADIGEALRWVEKHWAEQPTPPVRLHVQGTEPESQLGAPRMAAVFWRYLTVSGDAMESVSVTETCHHPRLPQDRDGTLLGILCACTTEGCTRLHCPDCYGLGTRTMTRDRFSYPMAAAIDRLSHEPAWYAIVVALARSGWSVRKAGTTDQKALTAIRKLHSRYSTVKVPSVAWTDKSDSQRAAETAA